MELSQLQSSLLEPRIQEMVDAGVFYGCHKSKTNPKLKHLIFGNRGGVEIVDLTKTLDSLDEALAFLAGKREAGGFFLVVATQPSAKGVIQKFAEEFSFPVVFQRWIGGLLTNAKSILGRKDYFLKLKSDFEAKAFEHLTKKERLDIEREIERLEELFGGVQGMSQMPAALIVVDPQLHMTAVREARLMKIPVIAFGDTNTNPDDVNHLILGNTKSRSSIQWFFDKVAEAVRKVSVVPNVPPSQPAGSEVSS